LGGCGGGGAVSPVGVVPTRTVGTSASIIFPCSIKIQRQEVGKLSLYAAQPYAKAEGSVSSGTGLPGLSRNKGH